MKAIAAYFRYISKHGRLDIEDELGGVERGKDTAFNIMLSMPHGTDPRTFLRAAREFVQLELVDHKYVMVLHDHQANPDVNLSVRAESKHGKRLNPRKAELHRWRESFARALRGLGVDAEATRQATRAIDRNYDSIWRARAAARGSLRTPSRARKTGAMAEATRRQAAFAWSPILGWPASGQGGHRSRSLTPCAGPWHGSS